jgi:hypothetical protein
MALLDLWTNSPDQLQQKQVHQLIAFAGAGKLLDDSPCSTEFRTFLASVPSKSLGSYAEQCLLAAFDGSGFALQDIVNEVGARLGASVAPGRYRGTVKHTGLDGLWRFPNGQAIVVEVKTTDAYSINLDTIAEYRRALLADGTVNEDSSSILLIVGRQETGNLEAQIRGSRYAWDIRVISVDALIRLMYIKEDVEDPVLVQRIHAMLIPREFTRLDAIAELLFSAAEDIKQEEEDAKVVDEIPEHEVPHQPKFIPVAFHDACVQRVQAKLGVPFVKRTRAGYSSPDKKIALICSVSKEHDSETSPNYWFAFHPHQRDFLEQHEKSYVAFGCGSGKRVILIPFSAFKPWLVGTWTTTKEERTYWHVLIYRNGETYTLRLRKGQKPVDLTPFLLEPGSKSA